MGRDVALPIAPPAPHATLSCRHPTRTVEKNALAHLLSLSPLTCPAASAVIASTRAAIRAAWRMVVKECVCVCVCVW